MKYLTTKLQLRSGDVVQVRIDRAAHVRLFDEANYQLMRRNRPHTAWGDGYTAGVVRIEAPREGTFHLVLDLGVQGGTLRHSVRVVRRRAA